MRDVDILIIGGGPGGVMAALTARKNNPTKSLMLVRKNQTNVIPCGIPYIFSRLDSVDDDLTDDNSYVSHNIELIIDEVQSIDTVNKTVYFKSGLNILFDKLIIASGSKSTQLMIDGVDKQNVWAVAKDYEYLKALREAIMEAQNIVIIGGGFIGVEFAEDISNLANKTVNIIEKLDSLLSSSLDGEFAIAVEEKLKEKGVRVHTSVSVKSINGDEKVESVELDNGELIPADLVIVSIGAKPNTDLIKNTNLKLGDYGGVWVDKHMQTSVPDIFAVGDVAEKKDFFTNKDIPVMLASTAATEARIAGSNLYTAESKYENEGALCSFCTMIDGLVIGSTGLTEKRATAESFEVVVGEAESINHYPGSLPGAGPISLKLIFSKSSGVIVGAQVMGPESISEMLNILVLAIQKELTVDDFSTLQFLNHPLLTSAPSTYPIIIAAQQAASQMEHLNSET